MADACDFCGLFPRVDGWRWCSQCGSRRASDSAAKRKQRSKEERQRPFRAGKCGRSMLSADDDEQIGGQARAVRVMEDKST
jgi:hypothetical protein